MGRKHHTNVHVGRGWGSTFPNTRAYPLWIRYANGAVTLGSSPSRQESIKWKATVGSADVARYLGTSNFDCLIAKVTSRQFLKKWPGKTYQYFGDSCPPSDGYGIAYCHSNYGPKTTVNQYNRAITEALSMLQSNETNLSESIATIGQTLGMLNGAWAQLALALLSFLRLNKSGAIFPKRGQPGYRLDRNRPMPDWADLWLEFVYGHAPLMGDIERGLLLLEKQLAKPTTMSVDKTVTYTDTLQPIGRWSFSGYQISRVRVKIVADIKFPKLKVADQFGLLNPFSTAWELTPWSFALDWLIPIGAFIANLTVPQLHTFKYGFTTQVTVTDIEGIEEFDKATEEFGIRQTYRLQGLASRRRALVGIPLPRLYYKSPFTTPRRFVTALALLHALIR